ncbi:hypothetical protein WJX72_008615 [[Myrmecia] bisecta]|uniref:Apyrase n=1 Tax=[Myrmecia] bisecta TaxID=41462 RepID=A0AAW1QAV5_9CHLO
MATRLGALLLGLLWLDLLSSLAGDQQQHILGAPHTRGVAEAVKYMVIIDAGSTGSRIHVYTYSPGMEGLPMPDIRLPDAQMRGLPGLSAFADKPQEAGQSLQQLLDFASKQVPAREQAATEVHLLATAGLRLLEPRVAEAILESCRNILLASPFAFRKSWASILSGTLEGVYGWVAANYASGALQAYAARRRQGRRHPSVAAPFVGVFELGGASIQVTFHVAKPVNDTNVRILNLPHLGIPLYTHSFLGFGQETAQILAATAALASMANLTTDVVVDDQASVEVAMDPCLPRGYSGTVNGRPVAGGGYFGLCRQLAANLIAGQCTSPRCPIGNGSVAPPLLQGKFLAIENFHHTASLLKLGEQPSLREVAAAGERYCGAAWPLLQEQYAQQKTSQELLKYCFSAAYIVALLHDGFGLGMDERQLHFTNSVTDRRGLQVDIDWTTGAAVVAAALASSGARSHSSYDFLLFPHRVDHVMRASSATVKAEFYLLAALAALFAALLALHLFGSRIWKRKGQTSSPRHPSSPRTGTSLQANWKPERRAD